MTAVMLDTCTCIELIRGRGEAVLKRLRGYEPEAVSISAITLAELHHGVARSQRPGHNMQALMQFCAPLAILPFDDIAALVYGQVRTVLASRGTPIGPLDTLIAAHALSRHLTVVTSNESEFRRVDGLSVENWLRT